MNGHDQATWRVERAFVGEVRQEGCAPVAVEQKAVLIDPNSDQNIEICQS